MKYRTWHNYSKIKKNMFFVIKLNLVNLITSSFGYAIDHSEIIQSDSYWCISDEINCTDVE